MYRKRINTITIQLEEVVKERDQVKAHRRTRRQYAETLCIMAICNFAHVRVFLLLLHCNRRFTPETTHSTISPRVSLTKTNIASRSGSWRRRVTNYISRSCTKRPSWSPWSLACDGFPRTLFWTRLDTCRVNECTCGNAQTLVFISASTI